MTAATQSRNGDVVRFDGNAAPAPTGSMIDVAGTRAAQEVQAMMVIAKKFPRDQNEAYSKIMRACDRRSLAEQAMYAYPRGGQTVTGPSIRLAEEMARSWGNIDFGIVELEQNKGESVMMAYAWDLETNTRQTKIFSVKHERHTRQGVTKLSDPRDIYEMTANQGSRRLRACILGIIPGDVTDDAVDRAEKTLKSGSAEPLQDRVRKMVSAFSGMGVTSEMIEKRLGHSLSATTEIELVNLGKIYRSLKDNMASRDQFFPIAGSKAASKGSDDLNDALGLNGDQAETDNAGDDAPDTDGQADQHEAANSWEGLVAQLASKCDCTIEQATDRIVQHVAKVYKADISELSSDQITRILAKVHSGDITV